MSNLANPFAASQSGAQSMLERMIPAEIMQAIRQVQEQLPTLLSTVKDKVESIEATQIRIEGKQDLLLTLFEDLRCKMDPDATPRQYASLVRQIDNLPVAEPLPTGTT